MSFLVWFDLGLRLTSPMAFVGFWDVVQHRTVMGGFLPLVHICIAIAPVFKAERPGVWAYSA